VTDPDHADHADHRHRSDVRRARREFLLEAAIEAEKDTGRRERTDEQARHSLWMRVARLVGGWVLVLLGLAAIPLPGPGWLMVLLGLTLLPYRWTDNLIREIRRRIPGIPEDGRIPTRTWVVTGLLVALATAGSVWWGLRDGGDDDHIADEARSAADPRPTTTGAPAADTPRTGPPVLAAASSLTDRADATRLFAHVVAEVDAASTAEVRTSDDPCADLTSGTVDVIVPTLEEAGVCFGGLTPTEIRAGAAAAGAKVFGTVEIGGLTLLPVVRHQRAAADDEPMELAIDGVGALVSGGADIHGDYPAVAEDLMREAGVLK